MITALEADPPAEPMRSAMIEYFVRSADFMRNTEEPTGRLSALSGLADRLSFGPSGAGIHDFRVILRQRDAGTGGNA